ncbi:MAG: hypothetical protein GC201_02090 [Alphaproteobacteria bacterium]|nr:hypothetical protein [Alphaproteobacteria bacterium]
MTIDRVKEEIRRFASSDEPEIICISGALGVGKTYAWKSCISETGSNLGMPRYSYTSLFGLSSLDQVKYAIFESTVPRDRISAEASMSTLADVVGAAEGITRKYAWVTNLVPGLRTYFATATPAFFLTVRNQLICLDDLERKSRGLSIGDVLGLASLLKEEKGCSVSILLNKDTLDGVDKEQFDLYLEKVVDRFLIFDPSPLEASALGAPSDDIWGSLISEFCVYLKIKNIRTISHIRKFCDYIAPYTKNLDEVVKRQIVQTSCLIFWSIKQPNESPSLEFIVEKKGKVLDIDGSAFSEVERRWEELLDNYGFFSMDSLDSAILKGIESGYIDEELFQGEVAKNESAARREGLVRQWHEAVDEFFGTFNGGDKDALYNLYYYFRECAEVVSPGYLNGVIKIVSDLDPDSVSELIDFYMERNADKPADFFDIGNAFIMESEVHEKIVEAFYLKKISFKKEMSIEEVLRKISQNDVWSQDEMAFLSSKDESEYYDTFKSARDVRNIVSGAVRFRNIINPSDEMEKINAAVEGALMRIAEESKLNRLRVRRFGIAIESKETTEDGN